MAVALRRYLRVLRGAGGLVLSLTIATALVMFLEAVADVPNAQAAYLLAVIGLAVWLGTAEAILGAIGGFLLANFLFTEPVLTLAVVDPGAWLDLLVLLIVGIVVGQLAGHQRDRARAAELREREARGLFQVSRALATASDTRQAMRDIVRILQTETEMARVWIGLQGPSSQERIAADTGMGDDPYPPARHDLLKRTEGDTPAIWISLHAAPRVPRAAPEPDYAAFRVVIEFGERPLGSIWSLRPRAIGRVSREETRLLAAAADQIGQALERDRLRQDATSAEIVRQSEALKSALLDSVSHDLRTPIATIRAAAGNLIDGGDGLAPGPLGEAIDRQAIFLDRLVTNLLDMSRIEAGELRPELHPVLLDDAVADTLERMGNPLGARRILVDIPQDLPPVLVDEVHLAAIVSNLLDNALKYSSVDSPIRVSACRLATAGVVRLVVEDGGPGVPDEAIGRLFEKFFRVTPAQAGVRRGSGIGLAIVRGLTESMSGTVAAERSGLGGLAVRIDLPATPSAAIP